MAITLTQLKPRIYQQTIAAKALDQNTLVVLPTGLGKTAIATMLMMHHLNTSNQKVIMVAPTKPLVEQHHRTFLKETTMDEEQVVLFTGTVAPKKRAQQFNDALVVFSTPQVIENDVVAGRIKLTTTTLLVIDEAHRATGNYSYVWLARQLKAQQPLAKILALTASPGTDMETVQEVCSNLEIDHIEYRNKDDPDVKPYLEETKVNMKKVNLPESYTGVLKQVKACYDEAIKELRNLNMLRNKAHVNKMDLLKLQSQARQLLSESSDNADIYKAISIGAKALKISHAVELLESQGIEPFLEYAEQMQQQANAGSSKAVQQIIQNPRWRIAVQNAKENPVPHPKMHVLQDIVTKTLAQKSDAKVIVFSQYRSTLQTICNTLNDDESQANAQMFVGQAKKNGSGMSQKMQRQVIEEFSNGKFNIACMSSVGEEGLDIPTVDHVVFFEPIPSAIRSIQRRGRTGRHTTGNVTLLVAAGTRDEAYRWVAHHKEKRMYDVLKKVKTNLAFKKNETSKDPKRVKQNNTLTNFINQSKSTNSVITKKTTLQPTKQEEAIKLYVDNREMHNVAIKLLAEKQVTLEFQQLEVGDLILSADVGIEYKKTADFVDSILDGRLLDQIKQLKQSYPKPLILIEGTDLYSVRNVHPNAIMGMLSTIAISYGIPVLQTTNAEQTAQLLITIAKREQQSKGSSFTPHASKKPKSNNELLRYAVSSFPQIGGETAKKLLQQFRTIKQLADADPSQLEEVDGVGEKIASDLYLFFRTAYK